MKSFLKFTLATILGLFIFFFLLFILFAGIVSSISSEKQLTLKKHTVLHAKLDVPIVDRDTDNPFESFSFGGFKGKLGLNKILENIEKAATDENIDGIFLDLSVIPGGVGTLEEIRGSLVKFKESGKFIYAHADIYTHGSYYLATAADKVFLTPEGYITWVGLKAQQIFFKRALDKLQIDPQVIRHGSFKSAAEPFILEKLSEENRQQLSDYINSIWDNVLQNISESRKIPVAELQKLADELTINSAAAAFEHKLVDSLIYYDQVLSLLKTKTEIKEKDDLNSVSIKKYSNVPKKREKKGLEKNKIAVIYASGNIVEGDGNADQMGADKTSRTIREARRDSSIKAIVLRVNSGGGSALASEIIWREVSLAAETKPVIASLGDVAASGGYYIVTPARKIICDKHSLTGSIGVIGLLPNGEEFMREKLGITSDVVKTNRYSDMGSFFRPLEPEEKAAIEKEIENIYGTFALHVSKGRGMTREQVDSIAGGRIYSGVHAKKIGLIDDFGGLKESIELAASEAGLSTYRTVEMPKSTDPFETLMKQFSGEVKARILYNELGENYKYYEQLKRIQQLHGIQAILPFNIDVY